MYTINYKKALLGKLFSELNNVDFVMVAPQEIHETSCDPKNIEFKVIRQAKARKSTVRHAIIRKIEDENIPHVIKFEKKMQVNNYAPNSLYTARKLAHSLQSHRFVKKCERKKIRRQKDKTKQTEKMRKKKFHNC